MKDMFFNRQETGQKNYRSEKIQIQEYPESGGVCGTGRSSGSG